MPRPSSKDQILDTAVQMASIEGLEGLSIGNLARATGKSKGGICAHFPHKVALQVAVVERAAALFEETAVRPALKEPPGLGRLQALMEAWFDYIEAQTFAGGCFFTNALLELDDLDSSEVLGSLRRRYAAYLTFLERCVAEAVAAGGLDASVEPQALAWQLQGIESAALVRQALGDPGAFHQARRLTADLIERHRP